MRQKTILLRVTLVVLVLFIILGCGILYIISLDQVANWPELAYLLLPLYFAILLGLTPVVGVIVLIFKFLKEVDQGEVFSEKVVQLLGRMRLLVGIFGVYMTVVFIAFSYITGLMHPSLLMLWLFLSVVSLAIFILVALVEYAFNMALTLRYDNEATV